MDQPRITRIYLEKSLRDSAVAGQHNFLNMVAEVLAARGHRIEYKLATPAEVAKGAMRRGYALGHMIPPIGPRGLVFRRVYAYPFWQIEVTDQRWDWEVARAEFVSDPATEDEARQFQTRWRKRLFGDIETRRDGFIYVPLQGLLRQHRSFQSCSPLDMLAKVRAARPETPIIATLHPKEDYAAEDRAALVAMADADPLLEVDTGGMETYLPACDLVVTQNSSAAFMGYFLDKPAMLFAKIDFHHIALGPEAWDGAEDHAPPFAQYLHWFWQQKSINAGHPTARARIAARFDHFGWP